MLLSEGDSLGPSAMTRNATSIRSPAIINQVAWVLGNQIESEVFGSAYSPHMGKATGFLSTASLDRQRTEL